MQENRDITNIPNLVRKSEGLSKMPVKIGLEKSNRLIGGTGNLTGAFRVPSPKK